MAKVRITIALQEEIIKKFRPESEDIFLRMKSLEKEPNKGKPLGNIAGIVIKELKQKNYRFFFITDGHILKFGTKEDLANLLIKFIRMSDKKGQQKTINEIKKILSSFGFEGF